MRSEIHDFFPEKLPKLLVFILVGKQLGFETTASIEFIVFV